MAEPAAKVDGSKAEAEWTYHYDPSTVLKEKPKFYFTADAPRAKQKKSSDVEISGKINVQFVDKEDLYISNVKYTLYKEDGELDSNSLDKGVIEKEDLTPGLYTILLAAGANGEEKNTTEKIEKPDSAITETLTYGNYGIKKILLSLEAITRILFVSDKTGVSE